MNIPQYALVLLQRLEDAGFPCYAVGGCVRDSLLGLQPHDYDLCSAATPEQMKSLFSEYDLVLAGEKHGTVGVITQGAVVEITTFRTEGSYADNRRPDRVEFVASVEADLARRDFTVNAMAWSPIRGLVDPFGGVPDLQNRVLRAVGDPRVRFQEDSLRILRGVRFAVGYGLTPEESTLRAMEELAPWMDNLARERVFDELCKLLPLVRAQDLLRFAPILTQVIPELQPAVGFDQRNHHHAYDIFTHTAYVTQGVSADPALRWAALLHDLGKPSTFVLDDQGQGHFPGHAREGAKLAEQVLLRLKAPTALRQQVVTLVEQHMTYPEADKKHLRRRLSRLGRPMLEKLLQLQEADTCAKGVLSPRERAYFSRIREILSQISAEDACLSLKDLAVNGHDLMALGCRGREIGRKLNALLELVLDEQLPNEKEALLRACAEL